MAKEASKKENKKEEKPSKASTKKATKKASTGGMRAELKKVVWPTPKELINSTTAVIVIVLITAILVFFLDVIFESINNYGVDKIRDAVKSKATTNTAIDATIDTSEVIDTTTDDLVEDSTEEVDTSTTEVTPEADTTTEAPVQ